MENDAPRIVGFEAKHLIKMPCNSLPLAVLIGSEPNHLGLLGSFFQVLYEIPFVGRDFIFGFELPLHVHAEILFTEIAYMAIARHHFIVLAKEFFYCFCLGRGLDYH